MKNLNYTLAVVIGAFALIVTLMTYRVSSPLPAQARVLALPVGHPRPPVGPSTEEFLKLSREKADLDLELVETRKKLAEHEIALAQTKQSLEELRRPMTVDWISAALRAELKSGEVVVTGGYKLSNGKRLYAFAQPVVQQVDGADVVKIGVEIFKITDEQGLAVGLNTIATNAANTLQHGEVWMADEYGSVSGKLRSALGIEEATLNAPITVLPGSTGEINDGDLKMKLTPVLASDHNKMDFEVRLDQPLEPSDTANTSKPKL